MSRGRLVEVNQAALGYYRDRYAASWAPGYLAGRLGDGLAPTAEQRYQPGTRRRAGPTWSTTCTGRMSATRSCSRPGWPPGRRTGRLIDLFRDRLILPLYAADGELVGFTARRNPSHDHHQDAAAKYLNTPDTALYH